jgi:hypothetical protein
MKFFGFGLLALVIGSLSADATAINVNLGAAALSRCWQDRQ